MDKKPYEEIITKEFDFLIKKGFSYEYLYNKGSDCSCVYIYRFQKGADFFDFREVSGGEERSFVVFSKGEYVFPNLKKRHKKIFADFKRKHFFKRPTTEEKWRLAALLLKAETISGDLFGIII